jgi:RNA polymerase sigma factor (sigma-70 family)
MDTPELNDRLSRISTQWTMILRAHGGSGEGPDTARAELMQRYCGAVYRYLLGVVRDPDAASDLAQEFALRFARGAFHRADPHRGRFRDYVKGALAHLIQDYRRAKQAWPGSLPADVAAPALIDTDQPFLDSWREDLLDRTWKALAVANPMYHAVLLARVEEPGLTSPELAERQGAETGRPTTPEAVRKSLERAHKKFAELLVEEVAYSLRECSNADLEAELRELDLLKYCRSALEHRRGEVPATR